MATLSNAVKAKKPYVGPSPFEEKDEAIFFGRDREKKDLCSLVIAHGEVLLFAQSGAGKSSLLNAGVIPLLRKRGFNVCVPARVAGIISPAVQKLVNNSFVFNVLRKWAGPDCDLEALAKASLSGFLGLRDSPKRDLEELPPDVLIFDQLEEIFEIFPGRQDEREGFFQQIGEALETHPKLRVVFSMREDYIARLTPFVSLLPERMKTRFRLERLRASNALEAITGPLERVEPRRSFVPGVAEKLVENLSRIRAKTPEGQIEEVEGQFVEPVQLAVVCDSLWESLDENVLEISEEHLKKFGDVDRALATFYEDSLAKTVALTNVNEAGLRRWFGETLITPEGTRGTVYRGQDDTAGIANAAVDKLESLHLIRQEQRAGGAWYELCHDRFIAPIQDSNKEWLLKHGAALDMKLNLERRAAEWERAGRPGEKLLDATQLAEATEWLASPAAAELGYSSSVAALINLSRLEQKQQQIEQVEAQALAERKRAESEHELAETQRALAAKAQELALAQRRRAHEQIQLNRRLRLQVVGLVVFFAAAVAFAINYKHQQTKAHLAEMKAEQESNAATRAAREFRQEEVKAEALANKADAAKASVEKAMKAEQEQRKRAEALEQAAQRDDRRDKKIAAYSSSRDLSDEAISNTEIDPERSLLLALAGAYSTYGSYGEMTGEARNALNQALRSSHLIMRLTGHEDQVEDVAFSPSGTLIATGSKDGLIKLWDPVSGRLVRKIESDAPVYGLAFMPDDALIGAAGKAAVHLWDVASGKESLPPLPYPSAFQTAKAVAFSPDGARMAAATFEGPIIIWNMSNRKVVQTLAGHPRGTYSVMFSPTGKRLVSGGADGTAKIWNAVSGANLITVPTASQSVYAVAFSPDGSTIATAEDSSTAEIWDASNGTERHKLAGHTGAVLGIAFNPQGTWIATASEDKTVKIWDVRTGTELETLVGHRAAVSSVAFSPDGTSLVTGGFDRNAILWAPAAPLLELPAYPGNQAFSLAYSSDGKRLASGGGDGAVKIRDVNTGSELKELPGEWGAVMGLRFSPHGRRLVSAYWDEAAAQWDVASGRQVVAITHPLDCIAVSPDGRQMAAGGDDHRVRVWDLSTGQWLSTLVGHTQEVYGVAYSPDSKLLATASRDRTVKIWDARKGREIRKLSGHEGTIFGVAFSPDGKRLATASADETAKIWDVRTGRELATFTDPSMGEVTAVAFSPDGRLLATANRDKVASIWNTESGKLVHSLRGHSAAVWAVAFSPGGKYLATGSDDRTAKLWDVASGNLVRTFSGHTSYVEALAFSPDGNRLVTGSYDRTAVVWDVQTGGKIFSTQAQGNALRGIAYSPDGRYLVTSNFDGLVSVFDAQSGRRVRAIPGIVVGRLKDVAFSPDGTRFVTASTDHTAQVWRADSGELLYTLRGHSDYVNGVAFSPDGQYIATASGDETVRLWNADDGRPSSRCGGVLKEKAALTTVAYISDKVLAGGDDGTAILWNVKSCKVLHTLEGHSGRIESVAFSPNGRWIATGSDDKTVKLWDTESGNELFSLTGRQGKVFQVVFSPDGKHLATASDDGSLRIFSLDDRELLSLAQNHLTRGFVEKECEDYLHTPEECPSAASALEELGAGFQWARQGDLAEAASDFNKAEQLAPFLKLNPAKTAEQVNESTRAAEASLRAQGSLIEAAWFSRYGKAEDAIHALETARALKPEIEVPVDTLNDLCWFGALRKHAAEVIDYCEQAVKADPSNGNIRDSQGVALVLTGHYQRAIPDFEYFVAWTNNQGQRQQRQGWLRALRNGQNPLTQEEINNLLAQ